MQVLSIGVMARQAKQQGHKLPKYIVFKLLALLTLNICYKLLDNYLLELHLDLIPWSYKSNLYHQYHVFPKTYCLFQTLSRSWLVHCVHFLVGHVNQRCQRLMMSLEMRTMIALRVGMRKRKQEAPTRKLMLKDLWKVVVHLKELVDMTLCHLLLSP